MRTFALSAISGGLLAAAFPGTGDQGWLAGRISSPSAGREYQEVARWRLPEGEGWFIAVGSAPTSEGLRALGERLRGSSASWIMLL